MGCGKSTVGRTLQRMMPGFGLSDLDSVIEKTGGKSISEIFREGGEQYFRDIEFACLKQVVASGGPLILPLGGGTVTDPRSLELVRTQTECFYLKVSPETIREHLLAKTTLEEAAKKRPMLAGNGIEELMSKRAPLYESAATHIIDADNRTARQLAESIIALLG